MEKNELLRGIIEQMQLTPQEIIENFVDQKLVDDKFLTEMVEKAKGFESVTLIPSKKFITPKLILPGMYAYADGLIYSEFISEAPLQSIVGYADEKQILSWCLRSSNKQWSEISFEAGTRDVKLSGQEATSRNISAGKKAGVSVPATEYCFNYEEDGVKIGSAFMPSYSEGSLLLSGTDAVKQSLEIIGLNELEVYLWLSSEYDFDCAWALRPRDGAFRGGLGINLKDVSYDTRPVLALKR